MSLPKLNEEINYMNVKVPSGKTIGVRGWKVKDEKELLFTLECDENPDENKPKLIINFLKQCCDDKTKFDSLAENDIMKIAVEIRKLSKGDTIEYNYACDSCNNKFFDTVNLTKNLEVKSFDESPIKLNDNLMVTLKSVTWKDTEKLYNEFKDTPSKYQYKWIMNSIDSITYNGKTYTEFTPEEVEEWFDELKSNDLANLYQEFESKLSKVDLVRKLKCLKCKADIEVNFGDLLSFLVL